MCFLLTWPAESDRSRQNTPVLLNGSTVQRYKYIYIELYGPRAETARKQIVEPHALLLLYDFSRC